MQLFPQLITQSNLLDTVQQICRIRQDDITDRNNFQNIFISGRKVNKIPASSTDVATTDYKGDFNFDSNYGYLFIGTAWRRWALSTW